jgi:hypothetical protein
MTDANSASGPVTVVLGHGAFADGSSWRGVIERLHSCQHPGTSRRQSAPRRDRRLRVRRERVQSDSGTGPGCWPFLWWRRDHKCRHERGQCRRPGLRSGVRPRCGRDPCGHRGRLHGQRAERCHPPVALSRRIRVLLRSEATSTTVCGSRNCSAAGSRAITFAAMASRLEAWYSPSAVMILARRSRSAPAAGTWTASCSRAAGRL